MNVCGSGFKQEGGLIEPKKKGRGSGNVGVLAENIAISIGISEHVKGVRFRERMER